MLYNSILPFEKIFNSHKARQAKPKHEKLLLNNYNAIEKHKKGKLLSVPYAPSKKKVGTL